MTLKYNDLVAPMVAHGVYDFLALVYLSRQKKQPVDESQSASHD
jgi:hypothetical protein